MAGFSAQVASYHGQSSGSGRVGCSSLQGVQTVLSAWAKTSGPYSTVRSGSLIPASLAARTTGTFLNDSRSSSFAHGPFTVSQRRLDLTSTGVPFRRTVQPFDHSGSRRRSEPFHPLGASTRILTESSNGYCVSKSSDTSFVATWQGP